MTRALSVEFGVNASSKVPDDVIARLTLALGYGFGEGIGRQPNTGQKRADRPIVTEKCGSDRRCWIETGIEGENRKR